jgi:hypothetical protein
LLAGTAISIAFALRAERERENAQELAESESRASQRAKQAEEAAVAAQRDLEEVLAIALVQPLLQPDAGKLHLSKPGVDALWRLSQKPPERLWLRFVENVRHSSKPVHELRWMAEPVLIASIGLDPEKREQMEKLQTEFLQNETLDRGEALRVAVVAAALEDLRPTTARKIADFLLEVLPSLNHADNREQDVAHTLVKLTKSMEPLEAGQVLSRAAQLLTQAYEKEKQDRPYLADGLVAVAGGLEPRDACRVLIEALQKEFLEKEPYPETHRRLVDALASIISQLEPVQAARIAEQVCNVLAVALEKSPDGWRRSELAKNLDLMVKWLEPKEAASLSSRVMSILSQTLEKNDTGTLFYQVSALVDTARWLEPSAANHMLGIAIEVLTKALKKETDAKKRAQIAGSLGHAAEAIRPLQGFRMPTEAAQELTLALEKETNPERYRSLTQALASVAKNSEPDRAVQLLLRALEKETDRRARYYLVDDLVGVAKSLEPDKAADLLLQALEKHAGTYGCLGQLGEGLSAVADRLGRKEATRVLEHAAGLLAGLLEKEMDQRTKWDMATGLAALAPGLEPDQATSILTRVLEKETDSRVRIRIAESLAAVASRLDSGETARLLERCARLLAGEVEKAARSWNPVDNITALEPGRALVAVARLLGPADASKVCAPAIESLRRCFANRSMNGLNNQLGLVAANLIQTLEPEHAYFLSNKLAQEFCASEDANFRLWPAEEGEPYKLDTILTKAGQPEVSHRAAVVATAVGLAGGAPFASLPALPAVSEPLPCRLSTQDLVELLKMPTCFGDARKIVLKHLGNRYHRVFANHWEFVRFAKEQRLDLDFTTPPKRPARP